MSTGFLPASLRGSTYGGEYVSLLQSSCGLEPWATVATSDVSQFRVGFKPVIVSV